MAKMTPTQWRQFAFRWQRAGKALDSVHREELMHWKYDWRLVDALLDIGAKAPRKEEEPNGLVEMQRGFMKFARKQGLLPAAREGGAVYCNDTALSSSPKLALFCSVKCPGKLILDTYDLCQRLRDEGLTVISGFHSPMERECLRILLRSPNPVIWCLARGRLKTIPRELRPAVNAGRLRLVSKFPDNIRHVTVKTAALRNRLVADMATAVVVAHAAPGSKMEALGRELLATGKPVYTFDHPGNAALIQSGARPITSETNWKLVLTQETP